MFVPNILEKTIKLCPIIAILVKDQYTNSGLTIFGENTIPMIVNLQTHYFYYIKQIRFSLFVPPEYFAQELETLEKFTVNTIVYHTASNLWYQIYGISKIFHFICLKKPEKKL